MFRNSYKIRLQEIKWIWSLNNAVFKLLPKKPKITLIRSGTTVVVFHNSSKHNKQGRSIDERATNISETSIKPNSEYWRIILGRNIITCIIEKSVIPKIHLHFTNAPHCFKTYHNHLLFFSITWHNLKE